MGISKSLGRWLLVLTVLTLLVLFENCSAPSGTAPTPTPNSSATVTVLSDQALPSDPHLTDYYIPSNATSAIVFLHGGGGSKEGLAFNLGIKNDNTTSDYAASTSGETWLIANQVMAVFPQGQSVSGNNFTWTNLVMISGVDDVAFLQNLASSIKFHYPNITKIYLAGHSNGGMMANRIWCQSPTTFDAYVSFAGPPSPHLSPSTGDAPCAPTTIKPYLVAVGDHDKVLQTTGKMSDTAWTIDPALTTTSAAWVDATPTVLNELIFQPTRVNIACGGSVGSPVTSGQLTLYSSCSGTIQLVVVAQQNIGGVLQGGDHCINTIGFPCVATLPGAYTFDPKTLAFDFLKNY